MRRSFLAGAVVMFLACSSWIDAQSAPSPPPAAAAGGGSAFRTLVLSAASSLDIPLARSREYYTAGVGMELSGAYAVVPPVDLRFSLAYGYSPLVTAQALSRLSAAAGVGVRVPLGQRLLLLAHGEAGYGVGLVGYHGAIQVGGSMAWSLGSGLGLQAGPSLQVGLSAAFKGIAGLYSGVALALSGSWQTDVRPVLRASPAGPGPASVPAPVPVTPPASETASPAVSPGAPAVPTAPDLQAPPVAAPEAVPSVEKPLRTAAADPVAVAPAELSLVDPQLEAVFPALYRYYREHPVGTVTVRNTGGGRADAVRLTLFVPGYTAAMGTGGEPFALEPGQQREVVLTAAFDEGILELTRPAVVRAELRLEYDAGGQPRGYLETLSLQVWDRSALDWTDPRRAAAFVTVGDPAVASLSRAAGAVAREQRYQGVEEALVAAMGVYHALRQVGVRLAAAAGDPCVEPTGGPEQVIRLRYPRETLRDRTGNCAELAILYCAMLESLGVESALVMVPGSVYPAFSLGVTAAEARGLTNGPEELIVTEGTVWVPVDLGDLSGGFLEAWGRGAERWRQQGGERGRLIRIREAWRTYGAVELPGAAAGLAAGSAGLDRQRLAAALHAEQVRFLDGEFWGR